MSSGFYKGFIYVLHVEKLFVKSEYYLKSFLLTSKSLVIKHENEFVFLFSLKKGAITFWNPLKPMACLSNVYAPQKGEAYSRRFVRLNVLPSIYPVPCLARNFKTTVGI